MCVAATVLACLRVGGCGHGWVVRSLCQVSLKKVTEVDSDDDDDENPFNFAIQKRQCTMKWPAKKKVQLQTRARARARVCVCVCLSVCQCVHPCIRDSGLQGVQVRLFACVSVCVTKYIRCHFVAR